MKRYFFDYINHDTKHIIMNEMISYSDDAALEFFNQHFLDLHLDKCTDFHALRLRDSNDDELAYYDMHLDAVFGEK